jgi:hypothetical protein
VRMWKTLGSLKDAVLGMVAVLEEGYCRCRRLVRVRLPVRRVDFTDGRVPRCK